MPHLGNLQCSVFCAATDRPFPEYFIDPGDGRVECFVCIPDSASRFYVRLRSNGFIAPGLAMVVWADGQYGCNRNRRNLLPPKPGAPDPGSVIDFKVRGSEKWTNDGQCWIRPWKFKPITEEDQQYYAEHPSGERRGRRYGFIEVLVYRCSPDPIPTDPLSAFGPSPRSSALGVQSRQGSWQFVFGGSGPEEQPMGKIIPFGGDGAGDEADGEPDDKAKKKKKSFLVMTRRKSAPNEIAIERRTSPGTRTYQRRLVDSHSTQRVEKDKDADRKSHRSSTSYHPKAKEEGEALGAIAEGSHAKEIEARNRASGRSHKSKPSKKSAAEADGAKEKEIEKDTKPTKEDKSKGESDPKPDEKPTGPQWTAATRGSIGWQWQPGMGGSWTQQAENGEPSDVYVSYLKMPTVESPEKLSDGHTFPTGKAKGTHPGENVSHYVGKEHASAYHHSIGVPDYMDSLETPFARFIFRYRDKATLEKLLNVSLDPPADKSQQDIRKKMEVQEIAEERDRMIHDIELLYQLKRKGIAAKYGEAWDDPLFYHMDDNKGKSPDNGGNRKDKGAGSGKQNKDWTQNTEAKSKEHNSKGEDKAEETHLSGNATNSKKYKTTTSGWGGNTGWGGGTGWAGDRKPEEKDTNNWGGFSSWPANEPKKDDAAAPSPKKSTKGWLGSGFGQWDFGKEDSQAKHKNDAFKFPEVQDKDKLFQSNEDAAKGTSTEKPAKTWSWGKKHTSDFGTAQPEKEEQNFPLKSSHAASEKPAHSDLPGFGEAQQKTFSSKGDANPSPAASPNTQATATEDEWYSWKPSNPTSWDKHSIAPPTKSPKSPGSRRSFHPRGSSRESNHYRDTLTRRGRPSPSRFGYWAKSKSPENRSSKGAQGITPSTPPPKWGSGTPTEDQEAHNFWTARNEKDKEAPPAEPRTPRGEAWANDWASMEYKRIKSLKSIEDVYGSDVPSWLNKKESPVTAIHSPPKYKQDRLAVPDIGGIKHAAHSRPFEAPPSPEKPPPMSWREEYAANRDKYDADSLAEDTTDKSKHAGNNDPLAEGSRLFPPKPAGETYPWGGASSPANKNFNNKSNNSTKWAAPAKEFTWTATNPTTTYDAGAAAASTPIPDWLAQTAAFAKPPPPPAPPASSHRHNSSGSRNNPFRNYASASVEEAALNSSGDTLPLPSDFDWGVPQQGWQTVYGQGRENDQHAHHQKTESQEQRDRDWDAVTRQFKRKDEW